MKLKKDKNFLYISAWAIALYLIGYFSANFYFFPLGLLPVAIYEWFRTEGKKNTKPTSALMTIILIFQFAHSAKIFSFPIDLSRFTQYLPIIIPANIDQFIFVSAIVLVILSFTLIKYTWGSVTRLLAIILLTGSLIQASIFWEDIQVMFSSDEGQVLVEGAQEKITNTLVDRLKRELR
jgi:hypothetical protein